MVLVIGGSVVGMGLNIYLWWLDMVVVRINSLIGLLFVFVENKFMVLVGYEVLLSFYGVVCVFVSVLFKIGNDLCWMGSGFCCGLGEFKIFVNELGSLIMLGKVNLI